MSKTLHQEASLDRLRRTRPEEPTTAAEPSIAAVPAPLSLPPLSPRSEVRLGADDVFYPRSRRRINLLTWGIVVVGGTVLLMRLQHAPPSGWSADAPFRAAPQIALDTHDAVPALEKAEKPAVAEITRDAAIHHALARAALRMMANRPVPAVPVAAPLPPTPPKPLPVVAAATDGMPVSVRRLRPAWPGAAADSLPTPRKDALAVARPAQL